MHDPSTLAERDWLRFENLIHRFEDSWRNGRRPDIGEYLSQHDIDDVRVLAELAHVDLEFRIRSGEQAQSEDYLTRFPQLKSDSASAVELIAAEFAWRRRWGSGASVNDFISRFPEFEEALKKSLSAEETVPRNRSFSRPTEVVPQLPGFAIQEEIGRGGMGIVYKALDLRLNRTVALKTLAAGSFAAPTERERFRREAESIAHLDHPNIIPVYEVGENDGMPFFSMKYCAGGSLARRDRKPAIDPFEISQLVQTIAQAVHHAHQRGILHRDLKPSNILLDDDGRPHVTDFGLAKRFDPDIGPADASTIAGTPAYMAPEQAMGRGDLTTATDVYGLGAILYELLTGSKLFVGASPMTILRQLGELQPVRPTIRNPKVPRDLETITLKCLEKSPQRRYRGADELADDLGRWQTGEPITARPVPQWERVWQWLRRHPVVSSLGAATTLAVILFIVTLAFSYNRIQGMLKQEQKISKELSEALDREREHLYHERMTSAWRLWNSNFSARAIELLDDCPPRLRHWEWHYLNRLRRYEYSDIAAVKGRSHFACYSPDGKHFAVGDLQGKVTLFNAATGQTIRTMSGDQWSIGCLCFSPDGEHLAAISSKTAFIWKVADGTLTFKHPGERWVSFSPDGRSIATSSGHSVLVYDLESPDNPKSLSGHSNVVLCGAFGDNGRLATGSADQSLRFWNASTGGPASAPRNYAQPIYSLVWLPKSDRLVVSQFLELTLVDSKTGKQLERLAEVRRGQLSLAASSDGKYLGYTTDDGTIRVLELATGEDVYVFRGHQPSIKSLSFSPNAEQLLVVDATGLARNWKLEYSTEGRMLSNVNAITSLSMVCDGKRLAMARLISSKTPEHEKDQVKVINSETGETLLSLPGYHDVSFAADGKWLAALRADGSVSAWDTTTGEHLWNRKFAPHRFTRMSLSPDGRIAAATQAGHIIVWEPSVTVPPLTLKNPQGLAGCVTFSPDGNYLASANRDGSIVMWNRAGDEVFRLNYGSQVQSVCFSPDNRFLAAGGAGRVIKLWRIDTGEEVMSYHGHINQVLSVAFNHDGKRLISGGLDATARLWDVDSGREIMALPGVRGVVNRAIFSHDGRRIFAAALNLKVWELDESAQTP